jgi:hypothetical protein
MIKSELTDDTAETIIKLLKEQYATKSSTICAAVLWSGKNWSRDTYACYRYVTEELVGRGNTPPETIKHPDHFGIVFQGWNGLDRSCAQGIEKKEVSIWLDHLLDPTGPFKEILPHLYHKTTKEILQDKGFVIKDALSCNAGLLWTFLQATRLMYENPHRMPWFLHGVERLGGDMPMALFCAFALKPLTANFNGQTKKLDENWTVCNHSHGEPLGSYAYQLAFQFLNGVLSPNDRHCTSSSHSCFGTCTVPPNFYSLIKNMVKPFDEWVIEFNKQRGSCAKAA